MNSSMKNSGRRYGWPGSGTEGGGYRRGSAGSAAGEGGDNGAISSDGRERSRSRSQSTDRAGKQVSITKWTTPNRQREEKQSKDEEGEVETTGGNSHEGSENMEDEISSSESSKVEVVGVKQHLREDKSEDSEEEQSNEEGSSMEGSTYEDAKEVEAGGEDGKGEAQTVAAALGLANDTPSSAKTTDSGTPKAATFAGDTNFTQKKYPGSHVRRTKQTVLNPYAKAPAPTASATAPTKRHNIHDNHTYIRVQITIKGENDPPTAIKRLLGEFLAVLQQKDPTACFTKELNVRKQIYDVEDFPPDFREFYDDWSFWEHDAGYFLMPAPLGGAGRSYHGTVCLSSTWEGEMLLERCIFAVRTIQSKGGTIRASIKELQVLRTSRNLILFGVPSNVSFSAVTNLLRDMMEVTLDSMVSHDPVRYPGDQYQSPPDFSVVRMYVKNTPFEKRDNNDPTPSWAKLPLHLEVDVLLEEYLEEILKYMVTSRLINTVLGDYVWVLKNSPPNKASEDDKETMKVALRTHMAIVLSLGRVFLRGLENPDYVCVLKRGKDEDGNEKRPVEMTVRKMMMLTKVNGIRLWQFICPLDDGGWCGYYASGKVCDAHRVLAEGWSGSAAAHIRFKCISRGVIPQDMSKLLKKSFSMAACKEGERAKYVNGAIVSEQHASMLEIGKKVKSCKWVDDGAIYSKTPIMKASEAHVKAVLDDDSFAYTFKAPESVGGDTFAHSLINPTTGEAWKEGEKELHFQNAIATAPSVGDQDDDGSIASGESAGWESMQLNRVEIEGMEGVTAIDNTVGKNQEEEDREVEDENAKTSGLGKELREALVMSGRVGPGEDQSLGQDIQNLMRIAIAALKDKPAPTASGSLSKPNEGNTGKDRHASGEATGGQRP